MENARCSRVGSAVTARDSRPLTTIATERLRTCEVVVVPLDVSREDIDAAAAILSAAERRRAASFLFDRDRWRFVVARARLRQLLAPRLSVDPPSIALVYGEHGKPAVERGSGDPDVRFNLAHCEDLAVYAFATGREVGIDIERIRALPDMDCVADHYFSPHERERYRTLEVHDKPLGFFNCWTRKEAFIKARGEGLTMALDRFDVSLAPNEPARLLRVDDGSGAARGWHMESFVPAPGFAAAVVVETRRVE